MEPDRSVDRAASLSYQRNRLIAKLEASTVTASLIVSAARSGTDASLCVIKSNHAS